MIVDSVYCVSKNVSYPNRSNYLVYHDRTPDIVPGSSGNIVLEGIRNTLTDDSLSSIMYKILDKQ